MNNLIQFLLPSIIIITALMICIIGHEIMHGLVAYYYGDNTAKIMGRLSVNPIKHLDIVGSIVVPGALFFLNAPFIFGWAKPVPVNIRFIIENHGYGAGIGVAIAGVLYNLALAILCSLILFSGIFDSDTPSIVFQILQLFLLYLIKINIVLFVFNLLPIPPLDGSQVLLFAALKFRLMRIASFIESITPYGMLIIFIILCIPYLSNIVFYPIKFLLAFLLKA